MKQLSTKLYITLFFLFVWTAAQSQQSETIPTKGKEFWLGFLRNHNVRVGDLIKVFISSDKNVSGTLSIPLQGYSQNFTVAPNITTELTIPNNIIEHLNSDVIESKGAHILTDDTVSVFALNFDNYSADATKILPIQSIGTEYRITSYPGLGTDVGESEFVIVATEDNTELLITPTANLVGGRPANTTYTLNLSRGQSYQARAFNTGDLTGTTIVATSSSGSCRPFAVFSGAGCVNIPIGCTACDYIDDQEMPVRNWGKSYYLVPFLSTTSYAYKILADKDGTTISVNGGAAINLNAGQSYSQFNVAQAVCINSNNPISVTQFMQGASCSGSGDPAMFFVNAADQSIDKVTFATVNSTVLNQHNINVVMKDAFINQLTLDGTPVNTALFTPFPSCPGFSFFRLSIAEGSHTLASDSGFTAYVYGTGGYESYAFSVGSFSKRPPIITDTIFCTSQNVTLAPPITLFNAYWTTLSNPSVIIGYGQSITITPTTTQIYVVKGNALASGCEQEYRFSIEVPTPPTINIAASATDICQYGKIYLNASVSPASSFYQYSWTPTIDLDNPSSPSPVATLSASRWYYCRVSTPTGCGYAIDSVYLNVTTIGNISNTRIISADNTICLGESIQLNSAIEKILARDEFNLSTNPAFWSSIQLGTASNSCGSVSGNALYFNGTGPRSASTVGMNVVAGGTVRFALKISNGIAPCDDAEVGENVVLEYSINGGTTWVLLSTYIESVYPNFSNIAVSIPVAARTTSTLFRWRQLTNSGLGQDNWALDNILICVPDNSNISYDWSPALGLSSTTIANPIATPIVNSTYTLLTTDINTSCTYKDSINISVGQPFDLTITNDTTICTLSGIPLLVTPSFGTGHTYSWTPTATLSNSTISNPFAIPVTSTKYYVTVTSPEGCIKRDSVMITLNNPINAFVASANPPNFCVGSNTQLNLGEGVITDDFDPSSNSSWASITGGIPFSSCGSISGNALYFTAAGTRAAATAPRNLIGGGTINFHLKIASGVAPCEDAEPGEDVVLEYSNDGVTWIIISTFNEALYPFFTYISIPIPAAAQTAAVRFRWRQLSNSGVSQDNWAIDNVEIIKNMSGPLSYSWTPTATLNNPLIQNPVATPTTSTIYTASVTNTATGCNFVASVPVTVVPDFTISLTNDTALCSTLNGVQLFALASPGTGYSYSWSPSIGLSNTSIYNPIATPTVTTKYKVNVSYNGSCIKTDSVTIKVDNPINKFGLSANPPVLCAGGTSQLNAQELLLTENFDPYTSTQWAATTGLSNNSCGSVSGNAMYFNNAGIRYIQTNSFNVISGGYISFQLKIGTGTSPCDDAEAGEDVVLEYSINGGASWIILNTLNENAYPEFTYIGVTIPPAAMTNNTRFRWRQLSNSGSGQDNWALDNIQIFRNLTGTYTYTWTPSTDLNNASIYNPIATPTTSTKYYVTAYNTTSSCKYLDSIQLNVAPNFNISTSGDTVICNNIAIQLNVNAAPTGTYSIYWSPALGLSSANIFNPIATPSTTTNYAIQVRSIEGCIKNTNLNVTVNGVAPTATLTASKTLVCQNETIQMNLNVNTILPCGINNSGCANSASIKTIGTTASSMNYPFRGFYHDARTQIIYTQAELIAAGITPGQSIRSIAFQIPFKNSSIPYQNFTVKMACTSLSSFSTVSFQSVPNIVFTSKTISTVSGWNTLIFENPYIWAGSSNLIIEICFDNTSYTSDDNVYATNTAANTVAYAYTDGGSGCSLNASSIVSLRPNIQFNTCNVTSGGAFTYAWSPTTGISNPTIANPTATVAANTDYSVTISDGLCPIVRNISIAVDNSVIIDTISPDTSICLGENISLQVNNGINTALSTVWTPGNISGASISVSPTASTYYKVTLTGAVCSVKDSVEVIVLSKPTITINPEENICLGETLQLNATGGTLYSWTPAATLNFDNISNPIASPIISTLYNVSVENAVGCTDDSSVMVNVHIPPVYAVTADSSICDGASITLQANNGNPTFTTAVWTPGNLSGNSVTVTPTASTKYYVTLGEEFCSYEDSVEVTILNNPTITITPDQEICANATVQLNASGGILYSWTPTPTLDNPAISNPIASPTTNTQYTVLVENADGCTAQENVDVTVIQHYIVQATADKLTVCENNSVTLQATGGNTYNWVPTAGISNPNAANTSAQVLNATTFTVYSSNSCFTDSAKVTIATVPQPSVLANDTTICDGNSAQLYATYYPTGMTYTWSPSSTLSNSTIHNPVATPATSTDYTVSLSNGFCADVDTATVTVLPPLVSDVQISSVDGQSPLTVTFTNNSVGFTSYLWVFEPGDSSRLKEPTHTFVNPGEYHVQLFQYNSLGCFKTDLFYLVSYDFMIPNLITPNKDGLNDNFVISSIHDRWEVMITNRWGDIVYKSENYDGTFPGEQDLSDGIYYFYIKDKKSEKEYKGWVQSMK